MDLHAFGEASVTADYALVCRPHSNNQGLVRSKSRISQSNFTGPRLELIAEHMSANFAANIKLAI